MRQRGPIESPVEGFVGDGRIDFGDKGEDFQRTRRAAFLDFLNKLVAQGVRCAVIGNGPSGLFWPENLQAPERPQDQGTFDGAGIEVLPQ